MKTKIKVSLKDYQNELWRRGEIARMIVGFDDNGKPIRLLKPHQLPIYDKLREVLASKNTKHNSYVEECSRQFGKSFIAFVISVEDSIRYPYFTTAYIAPLKSQVNEIIDGNTFRVVFATAPNDLIPTHKDSALNFFNGSRIRLAGTDNKNYLSLRGGAAHRVILDEAGFMSDLKDGVLPTVRPMTKTTKGKILFASTPPDSLDHDFIDILRDHDEMQLISTHTIWDDKSLTAIDLEKIVNECKGQHTTLFKREYECQRIVESSKQVIPELNAELIKVVLLSNFQAETYRKENFQLMNFWKKYIILDTGLEDMSACIFAHYNYRLRKLVIESQVFLQGDAYRTDVLAKMIKDERDKIWPDAAWKKDIRYVADSNNPIVNRDLTVLYQLPFEPTSKGSLDEMVGEVKTWMFDQRVLFMPDAEMVMYSAHYAHWNKQRDKFGKSSKYGHYDHLAALVYLIRNVDQYHNPVPALLNVDPFKQFVDLREINKQTNIDSMFRKRR